jgi:hypothetical protein
MLLKTVPLHKYEVRFYLSCVNRLSSWGLAIHELLKKNPSADEFDELIRELRSQAKDNDRSMREILGLTVYEKLIEKVEQFENETPKI